MTERKLADKFKMADAFFFLSQVDFKKGDFEQALAGIEKAKSNYGFIGQLYTFISRKQKPAASNSIPNSRRPTSKPWGKRTFYFDKTG